MKAQPYNRRISTTDPTLRGSVITTSHPFFCLLKLKGRQQSGASQGPPFMTNLTKVETNSGVEIYIEHTTGESFTSISGYARMANLSRQAIQDRLTRKGITLKTAQVPTATGFKHASILDESLICMWLAKDNPSMAMDMMRLGVRKFLHTMAGFKPESDIPIQKLPTPKELALMVLAAEEKAERLAEALDDAVETIEEQKPLVQLADKFITDEGLTLISDFAKDVAKKGVGRNLMYRLLRTRRILDSNNRPYQQFVNSGYFVVKPTGTYVAYGNVCQQYTTYLTPKGIQWALKALQLYDNAQTTANQH